VQCSAVQVPTAYARATAGRPAPPLLYAVQTKQATGSIHPQKQTPGPASIHIIFSSAFFFFSYLHAFSARQIFFPPLIHTMICTVNLSREKKILRKEQNPTTRNHVGNAERTGRQEEAPHQFIHQLASSPVPRNAMQEPRPSSVACSSTDYS
jgi:hypothetical protein